MKLKQTKSATKQNRSLFFEKKKKINPAREPNVQIKYTLS